MNLKNITWPVFLVGAAIVLYLTYTGQLPKNVMGSFGLIFVLGIAFGELGSRIKFIDNWLGGGAILCIFGPAILLYFGILPKDIGGMMDEFMNKSPAWFNFFISTMICGALFSISQKILVKSTIKFLPTIVGGLVVAWIFAYIVGAISGFGGVKAIMMLGVPIMGGGVGAGALPLSQIYAETPGMSGTTAKDVMSLIMPAVIIGNVASIILGGILNRIGNRYPSLTGNGNIMRVDDSALLAQIEAEKKERERAPLNIADLGTGFFVCIVAFLLAHLCSRLIPVKLHTFVWLILLLTLVKATKLLPQRLELCTIQWSNVWVRNMLYPGLIPIGLTFISLDEMAAALSDPFYLIISIVVVVGAIVGAGLTGWLLGLYPVEAALAGGLCMSNMAQTGDLATLSAAKRLELLPYSSYSSRIGGSLVLVLAALMAAAMGLGG